MRARVSCSDLAELTLIRARVKLQVFSFFLALSFFNYDNADYVLFFFNFAALNQTLSIMSYKNFHKIVLPSSIDELSKLLNRTFRVKIGRTLYGFSGCVRLLGLELLKHLLVKALRCLDDVFRYKSQRLGVKVCFYFK